MLPSQPGSPYLLKNLRLVGPFEVRNDVVLGVEDGRIAYVGSGNEAPRDWKQIDLGGMSVCPGLIDTHVHGALGYDFMIATRESFETIVRHHARGGTTGIVVTTVTARMDEVYDVLRYAKEFMADAPTDGARILGAHIEGPFLSPQRPGVHDVSLMLPPETTLADELMNAGLPVRLVTLAPELPGAPEFIHHIQQAGVKASGGHSDAWDDEARRAFDAGLRRVTHTFNCMSTARKRGAVREAGLLEFALSEPEIICEAISDGAHIPKTLLRMLYRAKGADGITLITDASSGSGLPDGTEFEIAGCRCRIAANRALTADGTTLAGSTLTMWEAVTGMVELTGAPLSEAIRMASYNPACALGMEHERGHLSVGARADYLIFDETLTLRTTVIEGQPVTKA